MSRSTIITFIIGSFYLCLLPQIGYTQGDNSPDPMVNLGCIESATVTGSVSIGAGRGIPTDILWDPVVNGWATESLYHEYGIAFDSTMAATKEDPVYWQVDWPTLKNINYITCSGTYPNQPQAMTCWAVQIWDDLTETWMDLPKAQDGWNADTLRGKGHSTPTQTNWLWDGQLVWRGLIPVVTRGIRFIAYANPARPADSLRSFVWTGRNFGDGTPEAALIQYLDFAEMGADNAMDPLVNLALLHEAVVSANFRKDDMFDTRNQPADILYDPLKEDYSVTTPWGEFGYPWQYDAGYPEGPDDGFQYMIEWPVPKRINYFSWGGVWGATPQSLTPWALQYWDGKAWNILIDGIGGSWFDWRTHQYDTLRQYTPGVDADAHSIWMVPAEKAITTKKIRLAAWSDGIYPLFDFHIRCRGGSTFYFDERDLPFKAVLVQYRPCMTDVVSRDAVTPEAFNLSQNYPNPFNASSVIRYEIKRPARVTMILRDIRGRERLTLLEDYVEAGHHFVTFEAATLESGVYFYTLCSEGRQITRKCLLIK